MAAEDQADKTEEPTQKKLQDARDKGQVPKSREFNTWLILATGALILLTLAPEMVRRVAKVLLPFIESPHAIPLDFAALRMVMLDTVTDLFIVMGLGALGLVLVAGAAGFMQHGLVWSFETIKPEISKISLIKGFKRLFSLKSIVEFAKGVGKLALVAAVAIFMLLPHVDALPLMVDQDVADIPAVMHDLAMVLLAGVIGALAAVAGLDMLYQRYEFTKQQRMSRRDIKDEHKQTEGDPMVKARLRSIRMSKARQRMMAAVPDADVVVTNPTHYAVALKYDEVEMEAPTVVAKGADLVALRIREIALENKVPIVENPPLARALFKVEIDQTVPLDAYKAVAEVISYVWRLKGYRRRDRAAEQAAAKAGYRESRSAL